MDITNYLKTVNLIENEKTVSDDIKGLQNIGINITEKNNKFKLDDMINDFIIPLAQSLAKSDLAGTKEEVREKLLNLSHEYLALIDLAYDSKQNRLFEMKTLDLLTEECNYQGLHLGGSRKPDGIIYTSENKCKYGVIIYRYRKPMRWKGTLVKIKQGMKKLIQINGGTILVLI